MTEPSEATQAKLEGAVGLFVLALTALALGAALLLHVTGDMMLCWLGR